MRVGAPVSPRVPTRDAAAARAVAFPGGPGGPESAASTLLDEGRSHEAGTRRPGAAGCRRQGGPCASGDPPGVPAPAPVLRRRAPRPPGSTVARRARPPSSPPAACAPRARHSPRSAPRTRSSGPAAARRACSCRGRTGGGGRAPAAPPSRTRRPAGQGQARGGSAPTRPHPARRLPPPCHGTCAAPATSAWSRPARRTGPAVTGSASRSFLSRGDRGAPGEQQRGAAQPTRLDPLTAHRPRPPSEPRGRPGAGRRPHRGADRSLRGSCGGQGAATHPAVEPGRPVRPGGQVVDGIASGVLGVQKQPHVFYVVFNGRLHAFCRERHHCKRQPTSAARSGDPCGVRAGCPAPGWVAGHAQALCLRPARVADRRSGS